MLPYDNRLYEAFKAKDSRFDGRFFVGISSTGIYCRPVCKAKQPKAENCTFFDSAAAAEQAGYRPCLLCRPELAPGTSITDATRTLAQRAARMLDENCGNAQGLEELAARLGCTDRHLRRAFAEAYHVSPVQYLQTRRLLLAKSLLTDTRLSVLDVAMASGFGSLRRFNDLFQSRYRLSPTALRKKLATGQIFPDAVTLALGYRPPYRWAQMLSFLSLRAIPGVELVADDAYWRTVNLVDAQQKPITGWVKVAHLPAKNALAVTVSETLLPGLPQVLAKVRHLFDLYCDPQTIGETLSQMNQIRPNLYVPGVRLPGCFDAFEMSTRAVLGQQITIKAAATLATRVVQTYGTPIHTGIEGLTHTFPCAQSILALGDPIESHLGPLGVIATRARTIQKLAEAISQGTLAFDTCADPQSEINKLLALPGIGPWTAQYIAMRAIGWTDAFLETDAGVKHALAPRTAKEMLRLAEPWRPWRSYATICLWNAPKVNQSPAAPQPERT